MTQSSYLMPFIHGLLENSSKEVRERKRRLLERDYTETEEVLNVYLNEKYNEVTQILNVYRDVSQNLEKNRKAVQKMKRDINQCKSLLSFNRDELRRLWLELVEQRRSLELIEVLDRIKTAPEILKNLISAKAWPEATEYLLKITEIMTKEVEHVPALDAVKSELAAKRKILVDEMRSNLSFLVFKQPLALVINDRNNRITLDIADHFSDFYQLNRRSTSVDDASMFSDLPLSNWRSLSSDPPEVDSSLFKDPQAVASDLLSKCQASNVCGGSGFSRHLRSQQLHFGPHARDNHGTELMDRMIIDKKQWAESIVALTHCLHRLQKLSQAFHAWRVKMQNNEGSGDTSGMPFSKSSRNANEIFSPVRGLIAEIHNSITLPAIAEVERILAVQGETSPASSLADPTYLVELLQLLFPAFCMHFNAFMLVLNTIKKIKEQNASVSFQFLDALSEEQIWGYIQMEVQSVLSAHLSAQKALNSYDMSSSTVAAAATAAATNFKANKMDLNALMGKKRGAIPTFLSNVAGDSIGSSSSSAASNALHGGFSEESAIARSGEPFFSFSKTAHSLSLNSYLRENRINMPFDILSMDSADFDANSGEMRMDMITSYPTVCRPCADNIKSIYSLVLNFARLIESQPVSAQNAIQLALGGEADVVASASNMQASPSNSSAASGRRPPPLVPTRRSARSNTTSASIAQGLRVALFTMGAPKMLPQNDDTTECFDYHRLQIRCQLHVFLANFIERLYLPNAEVQLRQPIVSIISNQDALTMTVSQQTQRELGLQRPILTAAYLTNQALGETRGMAIALPDYIINCIKIGLSILETFLSWASSVYKTISVSVANGAAIPSAEWARDRDLSRFWTNFPVWQRMMAADAFATINASHMVGNPHDPQLRTGIPSHELTVFGDRQSVMSTASGSSNSNLSAAAAIVLGLSNLGLSGRSDSTFIGGPSLQTIPFVNSAVGQSDIDGASVSSENSGTAVDTNRIPKRHDILLHERETTRLAGKEMDNLLHIIRDEIGSSTDSCLPTAGMLTIKSMGRLRESLHWLERCVQNWLAWLGGMCCGFDTASFSAVAEELTALANATLLSVYLDVRVQAYNLFANLPRTASFWCPVDEVDVDPEITKCLVYWDQLQEVLVHSYCPHEIRFIFDGLGDFIAQIFLRIIPQITRMNVNGNRKMCRNIYKLQQALALLTENRESDLIRVKQLYELFHLTPETVVNRVIEQGVAFEVSVYQNLLRLYQRSHPSHDHSRTDDSITKLSQVIRARDP